MMKRVAVLVLVALLAGCGWFGGSAKKPEKLAELGGANKLTSSWQASVGKSQGYVFTPVVSDGRVITADHSGTITILDELTGKAVAKFDSPERLSAGVGAAQDVIAVGTVRGNIMAFNGAGKRLWTSSVGGEVLAAPEVAGGAVIVRTADGRVMSLDAQDGKRKWTYSRATPALTLRLANGVVVTRREVVLGFPGGKILALDFESGKLVAEFNVALPKGASELERVADVAGLPYLEERRICAATYQGRVACFEPSSGNTTWAKDLSTSSGVASDGKLLVVPNDDGTVTAFSVESGALAWTNPKLGKRRLSPPLVLGETVLTGDNLGAVHALSMSDGALIGRVQLDGTPVQAIVPMGNRFLVQTAGGSVHAIGL